jgi:regulatory protein
MAFKEIDADDYFETLKALAHKKMSSLKPAHPLVNNRKVYHYLATKGFEADLIQEAIRKLQAD